MAAKIYGYKSQLASFGVDSERQRHDHPPAVAAVSSKALQLTLGIGPKGTPDDPGHIDGILTAYCFKDLTYDTIKMRNEVKQQVLFRDDFTLTQTIGATESIGSGQWEELLLAPDLFVSSVNAPSDYADHLRSFDCDMFEFQFRFEGTVTRQYDENIAVKVSPGTLLIGELIRGCQFNNKVSGQERNTHLTIYCSSDFLRKKFGDVCENQKPRFIGYLHPKLTIPLPVRVPLYPRITTLAHDLARSYFTTTKRFVQAEGFVLIILAEILAILDNAQDGNGLPLHLSDRDFDKLHEVRRILIQHHLPPPSLNDLSRMAGMGTTKLKTGFKALFGQSVFAFAHDLRMRHARNLLRRGDLSICRVAEIAGYNYQHSFTVAFERHFGMLPRAYRRNPIDLDQREQVRQLDGVDLDWAFRS